MKTRGDFNEDVAFMIERLSWADEVTDASIEWFDQAGFAVVDEEVLLARSALQLLWDAGVSLPIAAIDAMNAADRQWHRHPRAFDHMFARVIARGPRADAMEGWVVGKDGRVPVIPSSHWWWRPSPRW